MAELLYPDSNEPNLLTPEEFLRDFECKLDQHLGGNNLTFSVQLPLFLNWLKNPQRGQFHISSAELQYIAMFLYNAQEYFHTIPDSWLISEQTIMINYGGDPEWLFSKKAAENRFHEGRRWIIGIDISQSDQLPKSYILAQETLYPRENIKDDSLLELPELIIVFQGSSFTDPAQAA